MLSTLNVAIAATALLAAALVAGSSWALARALLRLSEREHPNAGGVVGLRHALGTNAAGFLLIGTVVASSGLFVAALCRVAGAAG